MYKVNITSLLPPKTKKKFIKTAKSKGLKKRGLFLEALASFKEKLAPPNNYEIKHQDVDRIFDIDTTISIYEETLKEVNEVAKKLDLSRRAATREIICEYFSNNK